MAVLFYNNAVTTLAAPVLSTDLTATLAPGSGSLFSPGPTGGDYFCLTFTDAATGLLDEIVHVTNVTGDVVTIVRAQEGTTAQNWNTGDNAQARITAGGLAVLQTSATTLQIQAGNYAVDTGTANALNITLNPVPASLPALVGVPVRIKKGAAGNTGPCTLVINGLVAINVKYPNGDDPQNGELPANQIFEGFYNGTNFIVTSVSGSLALKAPLASPALTGTPTGPTAAPLTNNTTLATTAYADAAVAVETARATGVEATKAPLASPALTGTPTSPTAAIGTYTTQIATTHYVIDQIANDVPVRGHAMVHFTVSGTTVTVVNSSNLIGITRTSAGLFAVTFSNAALSNSPGIAQPMVPGSSALIAWPQGSFNSAVATNVIFVTAANTPTDPSEAFIAAF